MFTKHLKDYHPLVHMMVIGTVFISLTNSMSVVYLPIYLISLVNLDPVTVGIIVGSGALTATIGGFVGGTLSDILGRHRLLLLSLLFLGLVFISFTYLRSPLFLLLANVVRGLFSSFFITISKALMADFTTLENRTKVFANRYVAGNIGYSIGPIIGTWFGVAGNTVAFILSSTIYFLYFLVLLTFNHSISNMDSRQIDKEPVNITKAWSVFRKDKVLFLFIVGSVLLTTVHGEMSVTLSQYLESNVTKGLLLFGYLMSVNGVTVILLQVVITRWSERFGIFQRLTMGSILFTLGEIGFAFSSDWSGFFVSMIIFTLGEILIIPSEYAQIDEITPSGMRGMYYGAQSISEIGNFFGPWFGGVLLVTFGGKIMFLCMALFSLLSLVFYAWGRKLNRNRTTTPFVEFHGHS